MDNKDFFWLVGLLEGEGCFCAHKKTQGLSISIRMKDRDVVERVAMLLGAKTYGPYVNEKKPQYSAVWAVFMYGEKAAEWIERLKPYLGIRRTAQAEHALTMWKNRRFMTKPEAMANARKFRFATEEQHLAQREQALKIKLGTAVRPN